MARDWETWLSNSTGPASATEQEDRDRTEKRIADAVARDSFLGGNVRVFVKGSYANNTNVRRDSDVDIAVEWKSWAYVSRTNQATDHSWTQLGVNTTSHDMGPAEYRQRVEAALVNAFGSAAVDLSGNKAVTVAASSTTLDAHVVPCFRHKRWSRPNREPAVGIRLFPKNGGQIDNWPEQNRSNGNAKNVNTGRRYKQIVRALKRLENDMVATGRLQAEVHGYFIECLLYNLPDELFRRSTYKATVLAVLANLWQAIQDGNHHDWVEVNGEKWLWRGGQTWTPGEASTFAHAAWNYVSGNT